MYKLTNKLSKYIQCSWFWCSKNWSRKIKILNSRTTEIVNVFVPNSLLLWGHHCKQMISFEFVFNFPLRVFLLLFLSTESGRTNEKKKKWFTIESESVYIDLHRCSIFIMNFSICFFSPGGFVPRVLWVPNILFSVWNNFCVIISQMRDTK